MGVGLGLGSGLGLEAGEIGRLVHAQPERCGGGRTKVAEPGAQRDGGGGGVEEESGAREYVLGGPG